MTVRVGLFGGTFDPPHNGHVAALNVAWKSGLFDHLLVTVAGDPYEKSRARALSPAATRWAMALAAFGDLEGVDVSDLEIVRPGPTYTVDTVRELCARGWEVELLVGADTAGRLTSWHEAEQLAKLVTVGIFPRDGHDELLGPPWRSHLFAMSPVDLSSTYLRGLDPDDEAMAAALPPRVLTIFRESSR